MALKICDECIWSKPSYEQVPGPAGPQMIKVLTCLHSDCRDPVMGDPLPAAYARKDPNFCGIKAVWYQEKPKNLAPPPEPDKPTNVIQLT